MRLVAVPSKPNEAVTRVLAERGIGIFGLPEALHLDLGMEFDNQITHLFQLDARNNETKITLYRIHGDSMS